MTDHIIGDFTLISKTSLESDPVYENPAIITTTFPRAVRQQEGYEICLKSIAHAPVKNVIHNHFNLMYARPRKGNTMVKADYKHEITPRFYESQSDLLMEIHRVISPTIDVDLYERNGETTLKINEDNHWIKVKADFFLNRPFKFKNIKQKDSRLKKRATLETRRASLNKKFSDLQDQIYQLQVTYKNMFDYFRKFANFQQVNKEYEKWVTSTTKIKNFNKDLDSQKQLTEELTYSTDRLQTQVDILVNEDNYNKDKVANDKQFAELNTRINTIMITTSQLESLQEEIGKIDKKVDDKNDALLTYMETLTAALGIDTGQQIAIDTSDFVSNLNKDVINATEITVSSETIITTRLGLLYCDIVDNSLINNKQSRLLTTIPIISKRGYNYYEFKEPIYKSISILEFSTIIFIIRDSEGATIEFNLIGDDLSKFNNERKRKYPTFLNLHIRKRL